MWPTCGMIGYIALAVCGEVAHKWADWLHRPCHPEAPQRFRVGDKWLAFGQIGYITPTVWGGVPNAYERGIKSEVAHKWADWLHCPCHPEAPQRFRAGDKWLAFGQIGYITPTVWGGPQRL